MLSSNPPKRAVLEQKKFLDRSGVAEQTVALRSAAGQAFFNTSEFTLSRLAAGGKGLVG